MKEITSQALNQARRQGQAPYLLDVRELHEWQRCHIEGAVHIPLGELSTRLNELPKGASIVCYCRSGGRSAQACELIDGAGLAASSNLIGGITAWRRDIDPSLPEP